jgi:nicotinamidase-related amidase
MCSPQSSKQNDLDGNAPDNHRSALVLVDVISDFQFPGGDRLLDAALKLAPFLKELKQRARAAGVPVIYANDNFGQWRSSFEHLVRHCMSPESRSRAFIEQIVPNADDYSVLKPKHSAFYQTPLDILLKSFGTENLILTGFSTNSCILFTAQDAYMRDLRLFVPTDCVASQTMEEHDTALKQMQTVTKADIAASSHIHF